MREVGCLQNFIELWKGKVGILPSQQLLWFLASIYLDPGFEPLIRTPDLPALSPKFLSNTSPHWLKEYNQLHNGLYPI